MAIKKRTGQGLIFKEQQVWRMLSIFVSLLCFFLF